MNVSNIRGVRVTGAGTGNFLTNCRHELGYQTVLRPSLTVPKRNIETKGLIVGNYGRGVSQL